MESENKPIKELIEIILNKPIKELIEIILNKPDFATKIEMMTIGDKKWFLKIDSSINLSTGKWKDEKQITFEKLEEMIKQDPLMGDYLKLKLEESVLEQV